jgi:superoxide dismutase, Cu-Zn family
MIDCCVHTKKNKKCIRKKDMKVFDLPRKFTRKQCKNNIRGFTMRSSCAPYKYCRVKNYNGGNITQGVAVINMNNITGTIYFIPKNEKLMVKYLIKGLKDGLHGFHIHKYGDMTQGCASGCEHFDTNNSHHGGPHSSTRHAGDLGNILSQNGLASGSVTVDGISVNPKKNNSVIGRMIVIHKDPDDLGRGNTDDSLTTGSAGERIACAVIGIRSTKECK